MMGYYRLPPKKAFCHTINFKEVIGEDDWQNPITKNWKIENCWFNYASKFTRSGINASDKAPNASVTMTDRYCGPLPNFKVDSKISFKGEDYTIVTSKPLILNGQSIGWRLEVV